MAKAKHRYTELDSRNYFGHLTFPKLRDSSVAVPTIKDLATDDVSVPFNERLSREKRLSKSNAAMNARLGAMAEYRAVRNNLSYKPVLDVVGEDFPLHPEYLYVMDIITSYYKVHIMDVIEFLQYMSFASKEASRDSRLHGRTIAHVSRSMNRITSECTAMLIYVLYWQYRCNMAVLSHVFNIGAWYINKILTTYARSYDTSATVRADYAAIHSMLLELQGVDLREIRSNVNRKLGVE